MADIYASLQATGLPGQDNAGLAESAVETTSTTTQLTHDNLNMNANIQVSDSDVSVSNPIPIGGVNGGSIEMLSADASGRLNIQLDAVGSVTVPVGGVDGTSTVRAIRTNTSGYMESVGAAAAGAVPVGAPVLQGGVDIDGLVRTILTTTSGHLHAVVHPAPSTRATYSNSSAIISIGGTSIYGGATDVVRIIMSTASALTNTYVFFTDDDSAVTSTGNMVLNMIIEGGSRQSIECGFPVASGLSVYSSSDAAGATPVKTSGVAITVVTDTEPVVAG